MYASNLVVMPFMYDFRGETHHLNRRAPTEISCIGSCLRTWPTSPPVGIPGVLTWRGPWNLTKRYPNKNDVKIGSRRYIV